MIRIFTLLACLMIAAPAAQAVMPDEVLADPALEARARELSKELRCLVCQNQSIDDSNADLARDLRVLVRERLVKGDDDREVIRYIVARYGDYVLLKPPVQANTIILWAGPLAILLFAGLILFGYLRRRRPVSQTTVELTAEEEARVAAAIGDDGPGGR